MPPTTKNLLRRTVAVAAFVLLCGLAHFAGRGQPPGSPAWYSVVPPLLAVTLALLTNRLLLCLGAAVLAGGLLSAGHDAASGFPALLDGTRRAATYLLDTVYSTRREAFSTDNLNILLYVALIMAMISVMLAAGGLQGVAAWLMTYARSIRSTRLVAAISGMVIFVDDYANTMIVGATMRPLTDRQRISREKLAFLVDSTAAPIAGIAIISTWIGYEVGLLGDTAATLGVARDGYSLFLDALGFRSYCLLMIAFVIINALSGTDFGPMARAERRAQREGKLLADDARPMTSRSLSAAAPHPAARIRAVVALVPMAALLVGFLVGLWLDGGGARRPATDLFRPSAWRAACAAANSIPLLAYASALGLLLAAVLAKTVARLPMRPLVTAVVRGLLSSLLPVSVLLAAWSLKGACDDLQTGRFLTNVLAGNIPPPLFPAMVFAVAALTSFATGTSWGTMAILIPTALPVAFSLDGGVYGPVTIVSVAAVLDGSIFGDHCSPISDTTIMSSTASACDHLAHVRTQMPYSLTVAAVALVAGYLPAGLGGSKWIALLGGTAFWIVLFFGLRALNNRRAAD